MVMPRSGSFTSGKILGIHCKRDGVGCIAGLDGYGEENCLQPQCLNAELSELYLKNQSVPRSKHRLGYKNQSVNVV